MGRVTLKRCWKCINKRSTFNILRAEIRLVNDLFSPHSNRNYCFKLWLFKKCFPKKRKKKSPTSVLQYSNTMEYTAAPEEEKKKKNIRYFGPHHVFKSKSSILLRLLLSIGPENNSPFFHFLPCWLHIQPLPLAFSRIFFFFFFITNLIAHSTLTRAH